MMNTKDEGSRAIDRLLIKREIKFEQVTPYMGGDPFGYTWECEKQHSGKDNYKYHPKTYVGGPTAATIIGKMRYVASLTVASFVKDFKNGYASVYKYGSGKIGIRDKAGKDKFKTLGFLEALFGSTSPAFKAILSISVEVDKRTVKPAWIGGNRRSPTRYEMITMGDSWKECRYAPAVGVKPKIVLRINKKMAVDVGMGDATWELMELAEKTLTATMSIWGIGKAANRGFGRFKPENTEPPLPCGKNGYIHQLLESYRRVFEKIGLNPVIYYGLGEVPRLSTVLTKPEFCTSKELNSAWEARRVLEKIGRAVSRSQWKRVVRGKALLHTFPLGLPRHAKARGQKNVYTGYLMVKEVSMKPSSGCRNGIHVREWTHYYYKFVDRGFRRQSHVLVSVRKLGDKWVVDILGLPSLDLEEMLNGIVKSGKKGDVYRLFHVSVSNQCVNARSLRDIIDESPEKLVEETVRNVRDSLE